MVLNDLNKVARKFLNKEMYFTFRRIYFFSRKIKYKKYLNGDMYCPCCGNHITGFIDFEYKGSHYNPQMYRTHYKDTVCPICCSLPRQRMVASFVEKNFDLIKGKKILFFAPSYAGEVCMKRYGAIYQSADLYQFADLRIDIQNTGISNEAIDVILCNHVLEHVPDYKLAIQEMYRILRKNGILELSVPQFQNKKYTPASIGNKKENWEKYGQEDHLRIFGMDIQDLLSEVGFHVTAIQGSECPKEIGSKLGPADYDIDCIYICVK